MFGAIYLLVVLLALIYLVRQIYKITPKDFAR